MDGELGNDSAEAAGDFFREREIFLREELGMARTEHCDGSAVCGDGGFMGGGVDATGEAGDDRETGLCELVGQFFSRLRAIVCCSP